MVKNFKGEVKISDVQNEFDTLLNRINKMIDSYNGTNQAITDIDYTKGGSNLAPSGYTLTVAGLKQALKSLDGHVVGGKCFYNTANTVKMSDGLLFTKGGVFRLPDSILTRPDNGNSIWFDTNKEEYVWGQKRVRGRQTLTEEGATSLVKEGEGYKNTTWTVADSYTYERCIHGMSSNGWYTNFYEIGAQDEEMNNGMLKIDLKNFPHKSIPLESTEVEFTIMRGGEITVNNDDTVTYSAYPNYDALIGYYQDGIFQVNMVVSAFGMLYRQFYESGDTFIRTSVVIDSNARSFPKGGASVIGTYGESDDVLNGYLYFLEKNALLGYNPGKLLTDNSEKPEGVDTGKHAIYGTKFKISYPSPYANSTEKANPDNLVAKQVLQLDALDKDGNVIKYWDTYKYRKDGTTETASGIMSRPAFIWDAWECDKTDGELGSGRDKYIASIAPLAKCNMILFATPKTLDNDITFKQSEYNPTFNVTTGTYEVWDAQGNPDPDCYHITDYATARDSDYRNDLKNLQVQDVDGTFKITVKNRLFNGIAAAGSSETVNTSSTAKFVCAGDVIRTEGKGRASIDLLGTTVSYNDFPGHKRLNYWYPCNYLYLPKGVSSPYSETNGRPSLMCQFPFEVNIEKDLS